ncbi:hypothetical protein EMN47_04210 [Prolixibacteraceae bacterium JC049]|nr:hypothetical protein [Prolixibacteraceae bacterium JC049]
MHFIQLIFIIGLGALVIPIIIHLIKSNKAPRVWLGSLRFLEQAMQLQRHQKSWREIILLILRLLLITALVFLFARPFGYKNSHYNVEQQITLLMIDASGSMGGNYHGKQMVGIACEKANAWLKKEQFNGELIYACFADEVMEVSHLDSIPRETGCATDYEKALSWAQNRLLNSGKKAMRLVLFTDCQKSGFKGNESMEWPANIELKVERILPAASVNNGIQEVIIPDLVKDKLAHLEPVWTIDSLSKGEIVLEINGEQQKALQSNGQISWKPQQAGWVNGELHWKGNDAYGFDNRFFFRKYVEEPHKVHLIEGNRGKSRFGNASYFIEKALNVEGKNENSLLIDVVNQLPSELDDAIVFCDGGHIQENRTKQLASWLNEGGSLIYFLGPKSNPKKLNQLHSKKLFPVKVKNCDSPSIQRVEQWNMKHPALANFRNKSGTGLSSIVFEKHFDFEGYEPKQVLAGYADGTPAILDKQVGKGRIVVVSNPPNRAWTDWSIERMFLPVVRELILHMTSEKGARTPTVQVNCQLLNYPEPGIYNKELVVNADLQEQDVTTVAADVFYEMIGVDKQDNINENAKVKRIKGEELPEEWFYFIALIVLGLLLIEALVAYWKH